MECVLCAMHFIWYLLHIISFGLHSLSWYNDYHTLSCLHSSLSVSQLLTSFFIASHDTIVWGAGTEALLRYTSFHSLSTAAVEVLARPGAYLKVQPCQDLLPSSGGCWQDAFRAGGRTASVSPWLSAGSCLPWEPLRGTAPSMAAFSSKPAGESLLAR